MYLNLSRLTRIVGQSVLIVLIAIDFFPGVSLGAENPQLEADNIEISRTSSQNDEKLTENWKLHNSAEYGYAIKYPPEFSLHETVNNSSSAVSGVPSDLWFGEQIHIVTRIPALPDATFAALWMNAESVASSQSAKIYRQEFEISPEGPGQPTTNIGYAIRSNGADYFVLFEEKNLSTVERSERVHQLDMMISTFTLLSRTYVSPLNAASIESADNFESPISSKVFAGFNIYNSGLSEDCKHDWNGVEKCLSQLKHAGEDWGGTAGQEVFATADGTVLYAAYANYPGGVVIIEHTLPANISSPWGNDRIYSMYGHVSATVAVGATVRRGQTIATLWDQGSNTHLHFEIRGYANMNEPPEFINGYYFKRSEIGPGYTNTDTSPTWWRYIDPSDWIQGHLYRQVVLFDLPNFNADGLGQIITSPGRYNLDANINDLVTSIRIPSDWSVKAYQNTNWDANGGYIVFNQSVSNLGSYSFQTDFACTTIIVDNHISSIEIFDHPTVAALVSSDQSQIYAPLCGEPISTPPPPTANPTPTPLPTSPPAPSGDAIQILNISSHSVNPGERFNPSVTIKINSGSLLVSRGDHLHAVPEDTINSFGAWPVQAVKSNVGTGGSYTLDVNNDAAFQMTAPNTPGNYVSKWQLRVAGNHIGPIIEIPITVNSVAAPPRPSGWHVQYWNGYFSDNPWGNSRCKADDYTDSIPFTKFWGTSGPGGDCSGERFSVLFERYFDFTGGHYRFHCHRDGYCRIFINGTNLNHSEEGAAFGGMDWGVDIPAGQFEVKIEYSHRHENGDSRLEFWWQGPESYLPPLDADCNGNPSEWCGSYRVSYDSPTDSYMLRRLEGFGYLDHDWGSGNPGYGLYNDFSAEWSRRATFDAGLYRFYAHHDDGVRINMDDFVILDQWNSCCTTHSAEHWITEGDHQIYVNWFDSGGGANIKVWWEKVTDCYALNWTSNLPDATTVSVSPAPNCPADSNKYLANTVVTLAANPSQSTQFVGWNGDLYDAAQNITLSMDSNKQMTANFIPCYTLQLPELVGGVITINPPGNCNNGTQYKVGTNVAIYAYPLSGYTFEHWDNALTGVTNPTLITMDKNQGIAAVFRESATPLEKPVLLGPIGNALHLSEYEIYLEWQGAAHATKYRVELFRGDTVIKPDSEFVTETRWDAGNLPPGNYKWHIEAHNEAGAYSGWSEWEYFTMEQPAPPIGIWRGDYFSNLTLSGQPVLVRDEFVLDFDWQDSSPDPVVNIDFSARWTQNVYFSKGQYRFSVLHDDGARLRIDDMLVLDKWDSCCVTDYLDIELIEGWHVVKMDLVDTYGWAAAKLTWEQIDTVPDAHVYLPLVVK